MPPPRSTSYGRAGDAAIQHSHDRAVEDAIMLIALAGSIFPSDHEFIEKVTAQVSDRLTSFCVHSRRTAEMKGNMDIEVTESKWNIESVLFEKSFRSIVNKVVHSRDLHVFTFNNGYENITNLGDKIIGYFEVKSDRGSAICFCPYGLAYAYLSQIAKVGNIKGRDTTEG